MEANPVQLINHPRSKCICAYTFNASVPEINWNTNFLLSELSED